MRIGIIAMGRSGGYNLGEWISYELGYPYKHEPFLNDLNIDGEDIVVKWLLREWNEMEVKPEMDKWIGLWREDVRECAISHLKSNELGKWRTPYTLTNEWLIENENEIDKVSNWMNELIQNIKVIPEIQTLITYEGIYNRGEDIKKVTDYLGIEEPKYLHMLNPNLRLRNRNTKGMNLI